MESYDHHHRQVSPPPSSSTSDEIRSMHDIFSDPHRCAIVYYLTSSEEPVTVSEVESTLLEWSTKTDDIEIEPGDELRAWLLDDHILPMAEFGTVEYDQGRDVVRLPDDVAMSVSAPWQE